MRQIDNWTLLTTFTKGGKENENTTNLYTGTILGQEKNKFLARHLAKESVMLCGLNRVTVYITSTREEFCYWLY